MKNNKSVLFLLLAAIITYSFVSCNAPAVETVSEIEITEDFDAPDAKETALTLETLPIGAIPEEDEKEEP